MWAADDPTIEFGDADEGREIQPPKAKAKAAKPERQQVLDAETLATQRRWRNSATRSATPSTIRKSVSRWWKAIRIMMHGDEK